MGKGIVACAAIVVSILILAGCGGDSTISQQEYNRELELVCNHGLQQREETFGEISQEFEEIGEDEVTRKVQDENLLKLVAVYEETTEEIGDIDLPEGNEKKAEELVSEREEAAAKIHADPLAARGSSGTLFKRAGELAESFGAEACTV